jgi:methylmalonyl-CoA mutase cobalamin-binding subunit
VYIETGGFLYDGLDHMAAQGMHVWTLPHLPTTCRVACALAATDMSVPVIGACILSLRHFCLNDQDDASSKPLLKKPRFLL